VLIDRAGDVGGVWRDNDHPGAAVDVRSHLHSFSFAPNPDWRSTFARQHVVVATGALAEAVSPDLPGLEAFEGARFHSARWDHGFDLTGKRVAVIGTGASAAQIVPAIQPSVEAMTVFQRTPAWVVPRHDHEISERTQRLLRAVPLLQRLARARVYLQREWFVIAFRNPALMRFVERGAGKHLEMQLKDPELRAKVLPDYRLGAIRTRGRTYRSPAGEGHGSQYNAMAESFVDTFKTELIADHVWRTRTQLELAIVQWVAWFNNDRLHESLDDRPPAKFEALYATRYVPTPSLNQ
jgi:cation diffusion facilitator CzcD-associated flavoprotein CzcO